MDARVRALLEPKAFAKGGNATAKKGKQGRQHNHFSMIKIMWFTFELEDGTSSAFSTGQVNLKHVMNLKSYYFAWILRVLPY